MEQIGRVIEESTPSGFVFKTDLEHHVALHDYVTVEVTGQEDGRMEKANVLAEVLGLGSKNPLATERISTDLQATPYSYKLVRAEIVGYISKDGSILRPKVAPDPNAPVYRAEDSFLQEFFKGIEARLPLYVGRLLNRPGVTVPVHLQDLQFHLGIFAATRAGKSYLAGRMMEEILLKTPFPVVVIDIHADYVMMDRMAESGDKHGNFDVVVHYPPGVQRISGVTAEERELGFSPDQLTNEAIMELLGATLGELQRISLRKVLKEIRGEKRPFGLRDIISSIEEKLIEKRPDGKSALGSRERARYESLLLRLEDLGEEVSLPPKGTKIADIVRPKTLSVICLNGLRSRIQDAYASIVVDLLFKHMVASRDKVREFVPTFVFVEEAHRIASREGGSRFAVRTISTAIREGSKFGLFMTLISQRPRSIDPDILSNVGNYAVLRITNQQDQLMIESASESFSHRLIEDLPSLNQGEAVLVGPFVPLPAHVKVLERQTVHHGVTPDLGRIASRIQAQLENRKRERW